MTAPVPALLGAPAGPPQPLWRGGTCVWRIPLDPTPRDDHDRHWALLDEHERVRARTVVDPVERHRFVAAHGSVRELLAGGLGTDPAALALDRPPGRRPRLRATAEHPAPPSWSLSRAGRWALLAIGPDPAPVGVDVERLDPRVDWEAVAGGAFSPAENAALNALRPERRLQGFLRLWTAKEAFVKACGLGLSGLRDVRVHDPADRLDDVLARRADPREGWRLTGPGGRVGRAWSVPVDAAHDGVLVVLPSTATHRTETP